MRMRYFGGRPLTRTTFHYPNMPNPFAVGTSCRGCGSTHIKTAWQAQERMFGTGGTFHYNECNNCGALSINQVPTDLDRHYPSTYGSLQTVDPSEARTVSSLDFLRSSLSGFSHANRSIEHAFRRMALPSTARILDVGCGRGRWLHQLQNAGFKQLHGVDAYLPVEQEVYDAITIRRGTILDADNGYDLIAYHHVLEHIADPRAEIAAAVNRLKPGGYLLVRVPVADSWARRTFETCWVQWDAPRHLWLPTRAALSHLATENGLNEITCKEDSSALQIWGSRRYRANLSGFAGKYSPHGRRRDLLLRLPSLIGANIWAAWLNFRQQGDQVAVLWQRPPS